MSAVKVVTLIGNLAGRLESRSWEDEGKRRSALEVVARRVEFLGGAPKREDEEGGEVIPFEAPAAV